MIIKYENGERYHRCNDTLIEDEVEMSRPGEDEIVECPCCGEGMQATQWDNAKEDPLVRCRKCGQETILDGIMLPCCGNPDTELIEEE